MRKFTPVLCIAVLVAFVGIGNASAQCSNGFTAEDTAATCPPFTVNFSSFFSDTPAAVLWKFGDGSSSTDRNPTYTYETAGSFTVTEIDTMTGGCIARTVKTNFINVGGPVATIYENPTSGCAPLTVTFIIDSGTATSYILCFGDSDDCLQTSSDTIVHVYKNAGIYLPSIFLISLGCTYDKPLDSISVQLCNGIDNVENAGMKLYPNPTNDVLMIELPSMSSQSETIVIHDVLGKILLERTVTNKLTNVNVSSFPPGMYFVEIKSPEQFIGKFIKEND